jgi:hypothetical protein
MGKSEYQKIADMKKKAKHDLAMKCWPKESKGKPLLMIFAPSKERELLFQILEGSFVLPCHVVVVTDAASDSFAKHPYGKITWVNETDARNKPLIAKYLDAADMALVFEGHQRDLMEVMRHGVVVIGHAKSPFLQDYHPNEETGNSFTFSSKSPWDMFMALVRAHETYRFPYDWGNIVRGILKNE